MKIENNLSRMCHEIAFNESITPSYREKLAMNNSVDEETKDFKELSYLQKL